MSSPVKVGSIEHRDLFYKFFADSHIRFGPEQTPWLMSEGGAPGCATS
jgi:hypothetical protein